MLHLFFNRFGAPLTTRRQREVMLGGANGPVTTPGWSQTCLCHRSR